MGRRTRLSQLLMIVGTATLACACSDAPPLSVKHEGTSVIVNLQQFGEYGSPTSRARLTDQVSGDVVWEMVSRNGSPNMHTLEFKRGVNESRTRSTTSDRLDIVVPKGATYELIGGRPYLIEVWGPRGGRSFATFSL